MSQDLEEIIQKYPILKEYTPILSNKQFPEEIAEEHPQRGVRKLQILAEMVEAIAETIQAEETTAEETRTLLNASARFVNDHTREEVDRYAKAPYLEDTLFSALTQRPKPNGKTPLEQIVHAVTNIDAAVKTILDSSKVKKYKRNPEYTQLANLKEFFDRKVHISTGRKTIVGASIDARIREPRHLFERAREKHKKSIQQYQENAEMLRTFAEEEYIDLFKTWNPGIAYRSTREEIEKETHLPPQVKDHLLHQLKNAQTRILPTLEAAHIWLSQEMHQQIERATATLEGMIEYDQTTNTISIASSSHLALIQTAEPVLQALMSEEMQEILPEADLTQAREAKTKLHHLKEKIGAFRINENAYRILAEIITGERDPLQDTATLIAVANEYHGIYGTPSWKNKKSFVGIDAPVETLRKNLLTAIDVKFSGLATRAEEETQQQLLSFSTGQKESQSLQKIRGLIEVIDDDSSNRNKKMAEFATQIIQLPGYQALKKTLKRPESALKARNAIISASRTSNLIAASYNEVLKLYKETRSAIEQAWDQLEPEQQNQPIIGTIRNQALRQLQGSFARRIGILTKASSDTLKEQPESWLRIQMQSLEEIAQIVQPEDIDTNIITNTQKQYADELSIRHKRVPSLINYVRTLITSEGPKRTYILDTNVLLDDPETANNVFGLENQVVILADVLAELNNQKENAGPDLALRARKAIRAINASLTENHQRPFPTIIYDSLREVRERATGQSLFQPLHLWKYTTQLETRYRRPDESIIFSAIKFNNENKTWKGPGSEIVFVSKDVNARLIASGAGITAEPYMRENISLREDQMYDGYRIIKLPDSLWKDLEADKLSEQNLFHILEAASDPGNNASAPNSAHEPFTENEFIVAPHPEKPERTVLLRYRYGYLQPMSFLPPSGQLFPMEYFQDPKATPPMMDIIPKNIEQVATMDLLLDPTIQIMTIAGAAGTGKTFLAVAAGLHLTQKQRSTYPKLYLTMPLVDVDNGVGFLKGSLPEKLVPRFRPALEKSYKFLHGESKTPSISELIDFISTSAGIEMHPFSFMRGMSVTGVRILDEGQNTSPGEMKTFVTRTEDPSKTIVSGDPYQIDDPGFVHSNGFAHLRLGFLGEDVYGHISLAKPERGIVAELGQRLLPYKGGKKR